MRIAYLITSLGIGGAEKQVITLAERMAQRGHPVVILTLLPTQPDQWVTSLPVIHLDLRKSPSGVLRALLRARHFLRGFHPDLLHSHTFYANLAARLLRCTGAVPRVLCTIHNVYEGGWLRMAAYRLTDFLCLHTTAVSGAAAARFIRLRAVPARKCRVVPNAINPAEFALDLPALQETRAELGAGDDFIFLAAGRPTPAKDFPNLLHAFAQVVPTHPRTQLWIAGERPAHASRQPAYEALALPQSVIQRVRHLGLRRDMPALFNAADAFVLSSAWEGMPLVVAEAMAAGKPIIATDVGGVRELVGDTGAIVPARDASALAEAMRSLLRLAPEARCTQVEAARERVSTHFNMDARATEWESLYQALVAAGSLHPPLKSA
ncbi:MAG: glycosyltransferase [Terracidiphilus sp.]